MRLTVSELAGKYLEQWAGQILTGELSLAELPPQVAQFFWLGFFDGRATLLPTVDRLEHECDRLYMAAFTPKEQHQIYQRRLDAHYDQQAREFFAPVEGGNHDSNRHRRAKEAA